MNAWLNGNLVPAESVTVPLLCHSFSRGSGIFEVMDLASTARGPALFRLEAHVARLESSAGLLHMKLPFSKDEIRSAVLETVRANVVTSGAVKFFAYYGGVEFGLVPDSPDVSVAVFTYDPHAGGRTADRRGPVAAGISTVRKVSPQAAAVHAKACGHYVNAYLAKWEVMQRGCDDCIMLDGGGHVAEGSLANVFFVSGGRVITPQLRNALPGITRDSVMEVIRGLGIAVEEADITPEEALAADEAFYTGSVIRVKPIASIEGEALGDECPGPVTARISSALDDAYEGRSPEYEKWLTYVG
jgi:branched-chain amino acid aminotransferase